MIRLQELTPDAARADRTRRRCRASLTKPQPRKRQGTKKSLASVWLESAAVGLGLVLYVGELVLTLVRVSSALRH